MGEQRTDTERELLAATEAAIDEHGVAGVTTQKIADEWGNAQSLVHYYHDTKEDLIVAYIDYVRERAQADYESHADDPPLSRVESVFAGGLHADDTDSATTNALYDLHGQAPHNDRYRAGLDAFEEDGRAFLADAIRDGIEDGTFRDVDAEAASAFLLSASDGALLRTVSLDRGDDADLLRAGAERYVREVLLTADAREDWGGFGEDD